MFTFKKQGKSKMTLRSYNLTCMKKGYGSREEENIMAKVKRAPFSGLRRNKKEVHSSFYNLRSTNANTNAVYQELLEVLEEYWTGLSVSRLHFLEQRSLDYKSLGVSNIQELLEKMGDKVVWFENRKSKEKWVMSAHVAESRRRLYLKPELQELLNNHLGEIDFSIFENLYEDHFMLKLRYDHFGLTDLDHLCEVFKDDILDVGVAKSSGKKVIKAPNGINLKKKEEDA